MSAIPQQDLVYAWYASSGVTESAGKISQWVDTVASKALTQGTAINQPETDTQQGSTVVCFDVQTDHVGKTLENPTMDWSAIQASKEFTSFWRAMRPTSVDTHVGDIFRFGNASRTQITARYTLDKVECLVDLWSAVGASILADPNEVTKDDFDFWVFTGEEATEEFKVYKNGVEVATLVTTNGPWNIFWEDLVSGAKANVSPGRDAYYYLEGYGLASRLWTAQEIIDSVDYTFSLAPADPTDLTATPGNEDIEVAWTDNATNETSYTIQRSLDNFATVESSHVLAADADSYTDDGTDFAALVEGTTYYYRVFCSNAEGDSGDSNTDSALFSGYKYDITKTVIEWFKDFLTGRAYFEQDGWVFYDLIEENAAILNDKNDSKTGKPFWVKSAHKMETPSLSFVYMPLVVKSKAKNIGGNQEQFATFLFVYLDVSNSKTNLINQYSRVMAQVSNAFDENSLAFPDGSLTNIVRQVPLNDSTALQNTLPAMSALRFSEWKSMPDLEDLNNDRYALRAKFFITAQIQTQPTS